MWNVGDIVCRGCVMLEMWDVRDMGCSGCGMLGMWDVGDTGCLLGCGMLIYKMLLTSQHTAIAWKGYTYHFTGQHTANIWKGWTNDLTGQHTAVSWKGCTNHLTGEHTAISWKGCTKGVAKANKHAIWSHHCHYAFPQMFTVGGASWTFNPSIEVLNFKIKLASNKFILVNILAHNNFMWTRKVVIVDIVIWIIKTFYSLLKSHLAAQICTVSYVEYSVSS